jgi:hypothetical protein
MASNFQSFSLAAFVGLSLAVGADSYTAQASSEERSAACTQPIPEFKLAYDARAGKKWNPTDEQITKLCGCIWAKFPVGGWERRFHAKSEPVNHPAGGVISSISDSKKP